MNKSNIKKEMSQYIGLGIYAVGGIIGGTMAKLDEGNWGHCNCCDCGKYHWNPGSFGGKYITLGSDQSCAYRRCECGHHATQHQRN